MLKGLQHNFGVNNRTSQTEAVDETMTNFNELLYLFDFSVPGDIGSDAEDIYRGENNRSSARP